jgi:hypothetical protein
MMRLLGYIDESYNKRVFTLSCFLAFPEEWQRIEEEWQAVLRETNSELRNQGRQEISRFHAADCSSCLGEFAGWTVDEQVELATKLIAIIKTNMSTVMAFSMPLDDYIAVYPEHSANAEKQMYGLLLKSMMNHLIHDIETQAGTDLEPFEISFVHDRTSRDGDLQKAFDQMKADVHFRGRDHFSTIEAQGWETCIPLQAADLLAYENFKDAANRFSAKPRARRKSLESLLEPDTDFGAHSVAFTRKSLEMMRAFQEGRVEKPESTPA